MAHIAGDGVEVIYVYMYIYIYICAREGPYALHHHASVGSFLNVALKAVVIVLVV